MTRAEMLKAIAAAHQEWSLRHGDEVPYVASDEAPHEGHTTDLAIHQADRSAPAEIDDPLNNKILSLIRAYRNGAAQRATAGDIQRSDPRSALLALYAREFDASQEIRAGHDDLQLKNYWLHGEGAAKWSTFDELYDHLKKHVPPEKAKRIAAAWFHARYGYWPGSDKNRVAHGKKPRGKRVGPG